MTASLKTTTVHAFADGNAGHSCALGSAPSVGDVDILCANSDTLISTPSGFTLAESSINAQASYVFYRKAVGGESSSVTVTTSGDFNAEVSHSRWSGLAALDITAKSSTTGSSAASSFAVTTAALSGTGELVVVFAALHSAGAPPDQTAPVWSSGYAAVSGPNAQGSGANSVTAFVGYKDGAGTAAESPSVSWTGSGAFDRDALVVAFTETAGGITAALGIAAETDAAQALGRAKRKAIGPGGEADAAQALARTKARALGVATEVEAALPLGRAKVRQVGVALEADAAQYISTGPTGGRLTTAARTGPALTGAPRAQATMTGGAR